uniref:probable tubulin polyglutamylase TTLL9 n=1 Tax=Pristiophorus japonicus TaxID=55135 RepID=UPI00398EB3A3
MNRSKAAGNKGPSGNLRLRSGSGPGGGREQRNYIRFKCVLSNTLLDVLRQRAGWVEVKDEGEWDFYWCDISWLRENFGYTYMDEHVRVSHFRNHYEVARSQGKGIFLFRKLKDIMEWRKDGNRADDSKDEVTVESYVVQRYIENPYLIGGRKFDLRVYVLVMSYVPLKAWLYRDGFARFSNTRFSLTSIDDHFIHLTNVAVQKTAPDYDPEKGCKWLLQQLRQYMMAKHGTEAVEMLFRDMDNIFIKSLQSVQTVIINDKHCFELYGYDILIDTNLKPWLLEVNASPSLIASSQEDYELKCRLLEDTMHVVDMEGRLSGKEKQIGGFDLMWNDGPVYSDDGNFEGGISLIANTHLGCINDRKKQLWHLFKPLITPKK